MVYFPGHMMSETETEVVLGNLNDLTLKISEIQIEFSKSIAVNYEELLEHCLTVGTVREQMLEIEQKANSIRAIVTGLNDRVNEMYSRFENEIRTLKNVCETCFLVENIRKFEHLKQTAIGESNALKKSQIIRRMESMSGGDIKLEQIVDLLTSIEYVRGEKRQLEAMAHNDLLSGLARYGAADVKKSLMIFYNLESLDEAICALENFFVHECEQKLTDVFNLKGLVSDEFWARCERTFEEELPVCFNQVEFFYKNLIDLNETTKPLYGNHYKTYLWKIFHEMCNCLMNNPNATKTLIETEYPILLQCYHKLFEKINLFLPRNEYLLIVSDSCESAYLTRVANKWHQKIGSSFGKDFDLPSNLAAEDFVRLVARELVLARPFDDLTAKLQTLLTKTIKMYCQKIESKVINELDVGQVIERAPTTNQQFNFDLANCLFYLRTKFALVIDSKSIGASLEQLDELYSQIMQPLIASILTMVEKIILTIYNEKDWKTLDVQNINTCSPYMKELTQFLSRIQKNYLIRFENKTVYRLKCNEIRRRTIELFVRHSTFLKPISKGGRFRLQYDYAYLEKSLRNTFGDPDPNCNAHSLLKTMSALVNASAADAARSELTVTHPTLILFLLFSYAGHDLAPPYHKRKWTVDKFAQWLDKSDEQQVLEIIWSTLKDYEESTDMARDDPVFRLMIGILDKKKFG